MGFWDTITKPFSAAAHAVAHGAEAAFGAAKSAAGFAVDTAKEGIEDARELAKGLAGAPKAALDGIGGIMKFLPYILIGGAAIAVVGLMKNPGVLTSRRRE